jgi:hypothetical protein
MVGLMEIKFAIFYTKVHQAMYDKNSRKDWIGGAIAAALGAGVITTFAIAQGQHPLLALSITAFAIVAALLIDHHL